MIHSNFRFIRDVLIGAMMIIMTGELQAASLVYSGYFSSTAVSGYDTVAYFIEGKAVKGKETYAFKYQDAIWHFKDQQNLDKFKIAPDRYAPQYGGYCAWSVSQGNHASGDPQQWKIVQDKLYLNYDEEIQQRWLVKQDEFIQLADQKWPGVLD